MDSPGDWLPDSTDPCCSQAWGLWPFRLCTSVPLGPAVSARPLPLGLPQSAQLTFFPSHSATQTQGEAKIGLQLGVCETQSLFLYYCVLLLHYLLYKQWKPVVVPPRMYAEEHTWPSELAACFFSFSLCTWRDRLTVSQVKTFLQPWNKRVMTYFSVYCRSWVLIFGHPGSWVWWLEHPLSWTALVWFLCQGDSRLLKWLGEHSLVFICIPRACRRLEFCTSNTSGNTYYKTNCAWHWGVVGGFWTLGCY